MFRPGGFLVPSASGEFLLKNIAFLGVTLWLLADAIDATANKQRWPPALSISAHTHASVHDAALITRVNRWLG